MSSLKKRLNKTAGDYEDIKNKIIKVIEEDIERQANLIGWQDGSSGVVELVDNIMDSEFGFDISKIAEAIKSGSSGWINREHKIVGTFSWQDGYGAFTYSKSQLDDVVKYILNQPEHHKRKTFKEEYLEFLNKFDIPYHDQYLFDWLD